MQLRLLLLEEITSALDPELLGEVFVVVRDLARQGMTVLLVTHEMRFAREFAGRVVFMDGGGWSGSDHRRRFSPGRRASGSGSSWRPFWNRPPDRRRFGVMG